MKKYLMKIIGLFIFSLALLGFINSAQAYSVYYYKSSYKVCKWVPAHRYHGVWYSGVQKCWVHTGHHHHGCYWIPAHHYHGIWYPAQRVCR